MKNDMGKTYGRLTILKEKRENKRTYYYCRCTCGTEKWIRADTIRNGSIVSCGCYNKEVNLIKPVDIAKKRFGKLVALKPTQSRDKYNGSVIWECKCECGNTCYIAEYRLVNGEVKSCGCFGQENSKNNIQKAIKVHLKEHIVDGTNIPVISRKIVKANNTSGVTGVGWDKSRNTWRATITFKGKVYYLGRYKNKEDAINARKEAEKKLFGEFLEWYNRRNNNNG